MWVRPPQLLLRHVETTAVWVDRRGGISRPHIWLSCVHGHIHIATGITAPRPVLSVSPVPLPSSLPPSPALLPRADGERFVLIMTGLSQWWVCSVACVVSCWQGLLACYLWRRAVAFGGAGLNTPRTVSPGAWRNAKEICRVSSEDKRWQWTQRNKVKKQIVNQTVRDGPHMGSTEKGSSNVSNF